MREKCRFTNNVLPSNVKIRLPYWRAFSPLFSNNRAWLPGALRRSVLGPTRDQRLESMRCMEVAESRAFSLSESTASRETLLDSNA